MVRQGSLASPIAIGLALLPGLRCRFTMVLQPNRCGLIRMAEPMDNDLIRDMFDSLGEVTIKRMFGGKGIYHQGVILALEVDGEILLKADEASASDFADAGSSQWTYEGKSKPVAMPYWSIPDAALDDPEEMAKWVRLAWEAALRAKK
jgi:DNA transformation protein